MYRKKPAMIIFDVGGTLFDDGPCIAENGLHELRLAAKNPDITDDAHLVDLWNDYMTDVCHGLKTESGTFIDIPLSAVINYVTIKAGLQYDIPMIQKEVIFDAFNSTRTVIDGVTDLLCTLKQKNIRTAVISNNIMSSESLAVSLRNNIPDADFEFVITSADVSFSKPDKRIFETAAAAAQLDPAQCWYCGDSRKPDVKGAKNSGMLPILLDTKSETQAEIASDEFAENYLKVNHWNELSAIIKKF